MQVAQISKFDIIVSKLCQQDSCQGLSEVKVKEIIVENGKKLELLKNSEQKNIVQLIEKPYVGKPSKPDLKCAKLKQFQEKNGLTSKQKRESIRKFKQYLEKRPEILKRNIQKKQLSLGKIKCQKPDCDSHFSSQLGMNIHLVKKHKIYADSIGFEYYMCDFCDQDYIYFSKNGFQDHQINCYNMQREILKAKNELPVSEDESLNSQEELEYNKARAIIDFQLAFFKDVFAQKNLQNKKIIQHKKIIFTYNQNKQLLASILTYYNNQKPLLTIQFAFI
ncbi:hypothetical protein ABPG72_019797 [Tetrahymena utriculariae]